MLMPECLLQKINVSHLPGQANQRRKTITSGEMKGSPKEYPPQFKESTIQRGSAFEYTAVVGMHASTSESEELGNEERAVEELKRHGSHQSLQSWTTSETFSLDDVVHLAKTMDERPGTTTNTEVKATKKEMASTEEPRRNSGKEKVTPLIVSSLPSTREHLGHLATTVHQRRENNTSLEMNGPCNEEISTENDQNCDSHESVRSLSISEALAQEDVVHLPKTADQRGEHVASGRMKGKPSLYVTCRDQNGENGSKNNQPLLKHKRKTRLSNKMDTVEKPSYGNTTAAGGSDGDNAAAIFDTAVRNGFIQQMHCGKASNHQYPVTQKKHVRLTKKTSSEKNKALKYADAMDDHQLSESLSEDYDLPDYDNILMIVDQLQMNYKDSGKPLEIQDAVHSYKMIVERNQNHSELLIEKSKNKRNQGHRVMKKPGETEKAKLQLRCRREEQQLDLLDVGSPEKQDMQQRNPDGWYEEMKKELTEKDPQHGREKQQLELRLRAQDMELQHLRNDINKLQEAQHPETEAGHGDSMTKGHLQKVEHEVFKLVETIKKQSETIEQLERKLANEDKILTGTGHLTQAGRDFFNAFREMYTTSVMSQLELRIQHLEREFSEMKTRTWENGVVLENYVKLHQSHKLMETESKMKEVMSQFAMLTQHNTALLNLLSSVFASECPCKGRSKSLFTQENMLTSTSGPQPANQSIIAHLDAPADDNEDFNKALTKSILSPQSELHQKKEKCLESAEEKTLRKKRFKPTKTSTVCENGEHSFFEVSNTRQFEKNTPVDEPQHEIIREDQETLDNIPGNHNTLIISPWEYRCTDLESEHSEERTHHAFCKAEPEQYKDPCLEWVPITRSPSQGQLRSKDRQDGPIRKNFNKMEAYTSTSNACMMSSGPEFGSGQLYNSLGYSRNFLQREPLMTTSRPQTFENSLSFPNRVREENQQTSYDKVGHHNASRIKPQKATLSTLQSKHPEVTHQASCKAEPKRYEEPHPERIQMTSPLTYDQLKSKDRQDESVRRNFVKMEAYSSVLNTYTTTSPAPGFGSGQCCNSLEHSRSFTPPISRPWRFVESVDSYLCRTWQQLHYHY
ncbi:uncharacterized protein LOC75721 isoform X2 [Mus musculus]|nr:uncharacterized protein LOC75721 isoform X2 [Mus musculus]|eukprot:XP_006500399.1 PREDICTED: uncharacterized protein LOC75721 isoform X2 [Mus musculus]